MIALSNRQLEDFAGNAIELHGTEGRILALSTRADASLTADQRAIIEKSARILPVDVPIRQAFIAACEFSRQVFGDATHAQGTKRLDTGTFYRIESILCCP